MRGVGSSGALGLPNGGGNGTIQSSSFSKGLPRALSLNSSGGPASQSNSSVLDYDGFSQAKRSAYFASVYLGIDRVLNKGSDSKGPSALVRLLQNPSLASESEFQAALKEQKTAGPFGLISLSVDSSLGIVAKRVFQSADRELNAEEVIASFDRRTLRKADRVARKLLGEPKAPRRVKRKRRETQSAPFALVEEGCHNATVDREPDARFSRIEGNRWAVVVRAFDGDGFETIKAQAIATGNDPDFHVERRGALITINTHKGIQKEPCVAAVSSSALLAIWSRQSTESHRSHLRGQVLRANEALSLETLSTSIPLGNSTRSSFDQPFAVGIGENRALAAWTKKAEDGRSSAIYAQVLQVNGSQIQEGVMWRVTPEAPGSYYHEPTISAQNNGTIIIQWKEQLPDSSCQAGFRVYRVPSEGSNSDSGMRALAGIVIGIDLVLVIILAYCIFSTGANSRVHPTGDSSV